MRRNEARPRAVDSAQFRLAMGQFAAGVTVVTTRAADGAPLGLTVTAFASLSLKPPLILACIDQRSETNPGFRSSGLFGVSLLAEGQEETARRFAVTGPAKFAEAGLEPGRSGIWLVRGALAQLECRLQAALPGGDHTVYVGEVLHAAVRPGRPLVYFARAYHRLAVFGED